MASIKQVQHRNPLMELKLTLCQRFQSLKSYINTELCGIVAAYPEETEGVANEIESLASSIKDNVRYNGSNGVTQPVVVGRVASDGQGVNAYAEPAIPTTNKFSDNCQSDGECAAEDESAILNHNPIS